MSLHRNYSLFLTTATALGLCSCAVKDGRLDFTWWRDAAAPVMEDDVIIESGGSGYYRATPAPAQVPTASIPREETTPQPTAVPSPVAAQNQPATSTPPDRTPPRRKKPAAQLVPCIHVVQPGDTLTAIARRYGTTVKALVTTNGMADANVPLRVNQQLRLPNAGGAPAAAPAPRKPVPPTPAAAPAPVRPASAPGGAYTVKAGDTLYKISRQYGVSPTALMQANGLTPETANTIRVGQTLRIPAAP